MRLCHGFGRLVARRQPAIEARSPSGKAKVCKTFIGGSIPPRASKVSSQDLMPRSDAIKSKIKRRHPLQWIFEPLETEPSFFQKHMFGCQAAYLFGKLMLLLAAGDEPWNGLLVCTFREFHSGLVRDFPSLQPHPVLPKWLYVSQTSDGFEETAQGVAHQARKNDPRIGVEPKSKKRKARRKR